MQERNENEENCFRNRADAACAQHVKLTFNVHPVRASETIYIRSGGSVDGTDLIQRNGTIYTFISNISDSIVVERSNIVIDGAGFTLRGSGSGRGIDLSGRHDVTIKNMIIRSFNDGIWLSDSSDNNITKTKITNNNGDGLDIRESSNYNSIVENSIIDNYDDGIELWHSSHNSIIGNNVSENHLHGIWLYDSSNHNNVSGNTIAENKYDGVVLLSDSNYNSITENVIEQNHDDGIVLTSSSNNLIYHNHFKNNTNQVSTNSMNTWDNGYPSGGNYWSDYNATDLYSGPGQNITGSDGIGDTPYIINTSNRDRYPKVQPPLGGGFDWMPIVIIIVVVAGGAAAVVVFLLRRRKPSVTLLPPTPPPPPPPP